MTTFLIITGIFLLILLMFQWGFFGSDHHEYTPPKNAEPQTKEEWERMSDNMGKHGY